VAVYDARGLGDGSRLVPPRVAGVATVSAERLAPQILRGKQIFHDATDRRMNRDGYLSCASCHPDGESDGMTWDFSDQGEGLRNTVTLLGRAGTRHGRVHWTGNFDEIQDFEHPIRRLFGGRGFIAAGELAPPLGAPNAGRDADLDALAAYVASLGAVSPSPHAARDARGARLFARLGCARCHAGAALTDSPSGATHDVGTSGGRPLDTPTLAGVWESAPYLHDGSAPTLAAAIARHRGLPRVTPAELAELVAYLLTLGDQEPAMRRP
jgi:cytochrome c peroxidase